MRLSCIFLLVTPSLHQYTIDPKNLPNPAECSIFQYQYKDKFHSFALSPKANPLQMYFPSAWMLELGPYDLGNAS